jgi:adenylate cyclase
MVALAILRRPSFLAACVGACCAILAWSITNTELVHGLENWALDGCFAYRGARETRTKVVLVGLDDESLDELGKPLAYASPEIAEVVRFLAERRAAAIGLDLIAPQSLSGVPELHAEKLGQAIADAGNVVLAEWQLQKGWLLPVAEWRFKSFAKPEPTDLGFVNVTEDDDQFVRRQQLYVTDGERTHRHFALALLEVSGHAKVEWRQTAAAVDLRVGGRRVPLDAEHKLRINFVAPAGQADRFQVVSFRDVLAAARGAARLRPDVDLDNAIVIIGSTSQSLQDVHATPYANNSFARVFSGGLGLTPGIELHANILATLEDGAYITTLGLLSSLPVLMLLGALLSVLFIRLSFGWATLAMVAHHFGWKALCVAAFRYANWRIEMVAMLFLGLFAYVSTFLIRWWWLRGVMSAAKSRAIVRALEADPGQLDLKGENRLITVLFADIRGFTSFSDRHEPHEVVALLNAYFSAIVPIIERHGGTIDKYIGDGVMVLFGAPVAQPDHAARAVRAAVAMVRRVHELQPEWAKLGNAGMRIGVGIQTGPALVGTMGSRRRLDYTAVGDTVNRAARIESANKDMRTEILVSDETYRALTAADRERLGCGDRPEQCVVAGIDEPVTVRRLTVAP